MSAMSILLVSQVRLELQVVAIKMGMRSQYSQWSMIISDYKGSVGRQLWMEMFWISHSGASILGGSGNCCRKPWDWCNPTFCRKPLKPFFFFEKKTGGSGIFWMVSCRLSLLFWIGRDVWCHLWPDFISPGFMDLWEQPSFQHWRAVVASTAKEATRNEETNEDGTEKHVGPTKVYRKCELSSLFQRLIVDRGVVQPLDIWRCCTCKTQVKIEYTCIHIHKQCALSYTSPSTQKSA